MGSCASITFEIGLVREKEVSLSKTDKPLEVGMWRSQPSSADNMIRLSETADCAVMGLIKINFAAGLAAVAAWQPAMGIGLG